MKHTYKVSVKRKRKLLPVAVSADPHGGQAHLRRASPSMALVINQGKQRRWRTFQAAVTY